MNIFALSYCPVESAQWQHDKHVVKMLLETSQILSTCALLVPEWLEVCDRSSLTHKLYKPSYVNHPCTKWARETLGNFRWLIIHGHALWREYDFRYGGMHKSYDQVIRPLRDIAFTDFDYGSKKMTPFATAMPDTYKIPGNAIKSYRNYYVAEKIMSSSSWTGRDRVSGLPSWLSKHVL